jgi:hypothetical protein
LLERRIQKCQKSSNLFSRKSKATKETNAIIQPGWILMAVDASITACTAIPSLCWIFAIFGIPTTLA